LHTLALLDIKVKEPTIESLARGKPVYMPPRYMSTMVAAQQLLEAAEKEDLSPCYSEDTKCFGLARIATQTQLIVAGTLK
jgi:diphthine synthase